MKLNLHSFIVKVRQALNRRSWLRYSILLIPGLAIIVAADLWTSAPKWLLPILAVAPMAAERWVSNWFAWLKTRREERVRSPLGTLVDPAALRSEIDSENQNVRRGAPVDRRAVETLRERLEAAAAKRAEGDPVTILTGNGESPMGQVVEKACSGIRPGLQCFVPASADDFLKWLRQGSSTAKLPAKLDPERATLFLLNQLDSFSFRKEGLTPGDFDGWRAADSKFLALAVLRSSRDSDRDPARISALNQWYQAASVISMSDPK
jgi:hypothetical protein